MPCSRLNPPVGWLVWFMKFYIKHKQHRASLICWWAYMSRHAVTDAWLHRIRGTGGKFTLSFFFFFVVQNDLQFSQMNDFQEKEEIKCFQSPFIPGVLSSWFLTTWFNHHTVFHVLPSSPWAKSLCRHEILTVSLCVCLCPPPHPLKKLQYTWTLWWFSTGWRLKGLGTVITSYRSTHDMNRKEHASPLFLWSLWLKWTLWCIGDTVCSCRGEHVSLFVCDNPLESL